MSKPQESELRRSGHLPPLDADAMVSRLEARPRPGVSEPEGPIPAEQRPGHHPDQEQDKPPLDDFAARLGVHPDDARARRASRRQRQWSPIGLALTLPFAGFIVARGVLRALTRSGS